MAISGIQGLSNIANTVQTVKSNTETPTVNFGDILTNAMNELNSLQNTAATMNEDFVAGKTENIHQVMIAGEEASLALQMVMEVRNKVLEAYQEIMRMNV